MPDGRRGAGTQGALGDASDGDHETGIEKVEDAVEERQPEVDLRAPGSTIGERPIRGMRVEGNRVPEHDVLLELQVLEDSVDDRGGWFRPAALLE
jgi:hypothetical protein